MAIIDFSCNFQEWDAYVSQHDHGQFSLMSAWGESLSSIYALRIIHMAVRHRTADCRIGGILPLILFHAPKGKRRLISLPYTDTAGILADNTKLERQLLSAALTLAEDLNVEHLEIRQAGEKKGLRVDESIQGRGFYHQAHDFKVGLRRMLPSSEVTLWQAVGSKVRNQVRKAKKNGGLAVVSGLELLEPFYEVFSENMRDLGSPVHDKALFETLAQQFSEKMRFVAVMVNGIPAATAAIFFHNGVLYNPWAASLRRYRPDCPNMLLYWTMLAHAVKTGCTAFDFGRSSPGAPACRFKIQWGARMHPMSWHVFSKKNSKWDPLMESLVHEDVSKLTLAVSRKLGPLKRKWISL